MHPPSNIRAELHAKRATRREDRLFVRSLIVLTILGLTVATLAAYYQIPIIG